jgi:ubiquinone/menaquinone biosynthesis C-methylase UbiE
MKLGTSNLNNAKQVIEENIRRHDEVATDYDDTRHVEIYNPTEQSRLRAELNRALAAVSSRNPRVLDFGCGTGNLTDKMLDARKEVWAADVSPRMLELLAQRHSHSVVANTLHTVALSGEFPLPFPDRHFSFVATYSVLHHVPDYLEAMRELIRVLDTGGVLYIDHEVNANYWRSPFMLRVYRALVAPGYAFRRIILRLKSLFRPRTTLLASGGERAVSEEGDIHVHPDDHIEWDAIRRIAEENGLGPLPVKDYLLCRERSKFPVAYKLCRLFTDDMGIYVGHKK